MGSEKYIAVLKQKPGIRVIDKVICDGNDETLGMTKFLGPNHDFFGQNLCPRDLGYEKIEFALLFPERKDLSFHGSEVMVL